MQDLFADILDDETREGIRKIVSKQSNPPLGKTSAVRFLRYENQVNAYLSHDWTLLHIGQYQSYAGGTDVNSYAEFVVGWLLDGEPKEPDGINLSNHIPL